MRKCNYFLAIFGLLTLLSISIVACAKPAEFEVISLDITPQVALAGDTISIAAEVKNTGQRDGSYPVILYVDDLATETQTVTLLPAASQRVVFSLIKDKAGSYQVSVGELNASFSVKESSLEQVKTSYPELYQELLKLPELAEIDEKDNDAVREIAYLALRPEYKAAFESILNEGIKNKRKYCTPLQALLWIAYDGDIDADYILLNYSLTKLVPNAWKNTNASENYDSNRWSNFEEVVDRLNSPYLVATYMHDNFSYFYRATFRPPELIFRDKGGACSNWARFSTYCLLKNGYEYDDFEVHKDNAACILAAYKGDYFGAVAIGQAIQGHVVTMYIKDGLFYTLNMGRIVGPFRGEVDAVTNGTFRGWDAYEFRDINAQVTKKVKNRQFDGM